MAGIIDTHFHIWDFDLRSTYPKTDASFDWPDETLPKIHRNILAEEAVAEFSKSGVEGAIFVQCLNSCPQEVAWLEELAGKYPVIKGIVGGLDLTQDPATLRSQIRSCRLLVGVRHILDVESEDWLLREDVHKGLKVLEEEGLVFDCLVRPHILKHVPTIALKFPSLRMVVDHISKPYMWKGETEGLTGWTEDMARAAKYPNVFCKLSGLVTEVDPENHSTPWTPHTFRAYIQQCLEVFGPRRCMFGSDWPVCTVAQAEHHQVVNLLQDILDLCGVGVEDKKLIFRENAIGFYKINI